MLKETREQKFRKKNMTGIQKAKNICENMGREDKETWFSWAGITRVQCVRIVEVGWHI